MKRQCQHVTSTNHSDDIIEVWTGYATPLYLCGYHVETVNLGTFRASLDMTGQA